jgi:hypothetical protein
MASLPPSESGKTPLKRLISVTLRTFRSRRIAVSCRLALRDGVGLSAFTLKRKLENEDVD